MIDEIRAAGGTAKLVWAANQAGDRIGPVPDDWADIFADTEVPEPAPRVGYRGTRGRT